MDLPIFDYKEEITSKIRDNKVTVIIGSTGCGKSTQVAQFILDEAEASNNKCMIIASQPRKIAAVTIARRISNERKTPLGSLVGYQIGLDKKTDTVNYETKLVFCTTGVVLEKLIREQGLECYSHIILDEIHEREIDTDLLCNIVREFLLDASSETKLILMSATLSAETFVNYFTLKFDNQTFIPAVVKIEAKRKFEIEENYLDDLTFLKIHREIINYKMPSITSEMYKLAAKLVVFQLRNDDKSILIFLPGIYEIENLHAVLVKTEELKEKCVIRILHSSLSTSEQNDAFVRSTKPRLILSTNIAESSVTIPDVSCIIDFCLTKVIVHNESTISALKLEWATQQNCIQRAGRTGRVCDGKVYRLVQRGFYEKQMLQNIVPEMTRAPLESVVLRVKMLNRESPVLFLSKCLDPPKDSAIIKAVLTLKECGGLKRLDKNEIFNPADGELTYVGRIMASLPLDIRITKLIVLGYTFSVMEEAVIIAAGLNNKSIFQAPFDEKLKSYSNKLCWANESSCDSIAMFNAFKLWKNLRETRNWSVQDEEEWCKQMGLERKNLHEMNQLILEINNRLKELKLEPLIGVNKIQLGVQEKQLFLKICIAGAFLPNYFILGESDEQTEREVYRSLNGLDASRTIYFQKMDPEYIGEVYAEQIKNKLIGCGITDASNEMKVTFDASKVYVEFSNSESMIDDGEYENYTLQKKPMVEGKAIPEIYKAMKFRKVSAARNHLHSKHFSIAKQGDTMRSSFDIYTLLPYETEEYAVQHNVGQRIDGIFKLKKNLYANPKFSPLPSFMTKELKGSISWIEHCNKFFFESHDNDNQRIYFEMDTSLKMVSKEKNLNPRIGDLVIIVYDNSLCRCRAKIMKIFGDLRTADCYFFDYGGTVEVNLDQIYKLSSELTETFFSIHERVFECSLSQIKPSYKKCPRGKWTKDAVEYFKQLALEKDGTIQVYSLVRDTVSVELIVDGININDHLVELGYAQRCEEPYVSRLNNEERKNVQISNPAKWNVANEFKDKPNNMIKISISSPPLYQCKNIIRLHGPFSPLECTRITGISTQNYGLISIEPASVNSIALNDDVESYEGKLIIAAEIMKNRDSGSTLHNVTIMPNITRGLPVLLGMIFAPAMVFYRNADRTRIFAIKFGLGADSKNSVPYFYEHDCMLPLNFILTAEDATEINELRFTMSFLLKTDPTEIIPTMSDEKKIESMQNIKDLTLKILSKNRIAQKEESLLSYDSQLWETEDQSDMLPSNEKIDVFDTGYCQIQFPTLYEN